jgi:hypothetical protein
MSIRKSEENNSGSRRKRENYRRKYAGIGSLYRRNRWRADGNMVLRAAHQWSA